MSVPAVITEDVVGKNLLDRREDFVRAFGTAVGAEKFIQDAFSAINANPKLRECTPESLIGSLYFAAQLQLPVGGPLAQFHLTIRNVYNPRSKQKELTVVPVVGYNGLIVLAQRSGQYDTVEGKTVYSNDEFDAPWDDETGTHFKLRPAMGDRGRLIGVVGIARVKGSDRSIVEYITAEDIYKNMRPQQWEKTPWKTHEDAMFKKSGIRRVQKYTAKSVAAEQFARAADEDEAVHRFEDGAIEVERKHSESDDWDAQIRACEDKADLEMVWRHIAEVDGTDVALKYKPLVSQVGSTLTKDSRPKAQQPSAAEREAVEVGQ